MIYVKPSIATVYEDFIWKSEQTGLGEKLYANPPKTFGSFRDRIPLLAQKYQKTEWHSEDRIKRIQSVLKRINNDLHVLTPRVKENIEKLGYGAIESAHQSVVLGGPSFILNKAATAERIASINSTDEYPLAPFFCVADYDIVQNELTHIRTPLMGSGGTIVSIPVSEGYEFSPVSAIPLPDYSWYEKVEDDIWAGYSPMSKNLEGAAKRVYLERLQIALSIARSGFVNSNTLGEWFTWIMAHLFNISGNIGTPFLVASDPEVRKLWALGMEILLERENRERFLNIHNAYTDLIIDGGFETGIGRREQDYVPFYYECNNPECHNSRTELSYEARGTNAGLLGKCPSCGNSIELEISSSAPDLSEYAVHLSPRVDTRQFIIDASLPVLAHAGGPGETAYYAQVIPIANEMNFPFPLYVKYPRVFFNTPWNENLGKSLEERDFPVLHRSDMFKIIGKISRFRKKERFEEMNEQIRDLISFIRSTYQELNQNLQELSSRIDNTEGKADEKDLMTKLDLERYLSWTYGQYAIGKKAQESSWSWIEWAINAGLSDLFGPYQRAYVGEMNNGSTLFINFSV
ncbi:MAG: bacillithiol biosynthesis BshC [Candidatus Thorarchaeota archaeon]|nr:bacillithiol biosynthesis BshC [Candidatus Thorarchaeota archaeon]